MRIDYLCGHWVCVCFSQKRSESKRMERKMMSEEWGRKGIMARMVCYNATQLDISSLLSMGRTRFTPYSMEKRTTMKVLWSVMWSQWFEM